MGNMITEDTIFLLARELEWAEAYLEEYPDCELGWLFFYLVERELGAAEADGGRPSPDWR